MPDLDAQSLADHAVMLGLVSRADARQAVAESEDGSIDGVSRSFLRKGLLTSWQLERLKKDDPSGFFYGGCKVLFHLAEGTFARVYRGVKVDTGNAVGHQGAAATGSSPIPRPSSGFRRKPRPA